VRNERYAVSWKKQTDCKRIAEMNKDRAGNERDYKAHNCTSSLPLIIVDLVWTETVEKLSWFV